MLRAEIPGRFPTHPRDPVRHMLSVFFLLAAKQRGLDTPSLNAKSLSRAVFSTPCTLSLSFLSLSLAQSLARSLVFSLRFLAVSLSRCLALSLSRSLALSLSRSFFLASARSLYRSLSRCIKKTHARARTRRMTSTLNPKPQNLNPKPVCVLEPGKAIDMISTRDLGVWLGFRVLNMGFTVSDMISQGI
jgi:hypothetical protein